MPYPGQQYVATLVVPGADPTTTATARALDPAGAITDLAPALDPNTPTLLTATVAVTLTPGVWAFAWDVQGPGAPQLADTDRLQTFGVGPDPLQPAAGFTYATTADLAAYTGQAPDPTTARLLVDASREIDRLTATAYYAVDPTTDLACDTRIRQALADATCELVGWWAETGMDTGARAMFQSAGIAGVSVSLNLSAAGAGSDPRVGPKILTILANAGLLAGPVITYG